MERSENEVRTAVLRRYLKRRVRRLLEMVRLFLAIVFWGYTGLLFFGVVALEWVGERNITTAFALYLPQQVWLLPYAAMLPVFLLLHWRLVPLLMLAVFGFVGVFMDWQWGGGAALHPAPQDPSSLRVLSYNRGQRAGSLRPFKDAVSPGLVVFQESAHSAARYLRAPGYEEFAHAESIGEFTVLSRFPIVDKTLLDFGEAAFDYGGAARFEIDYGGRRIAVYNVHLPTPRSILGYYRRWAFLWGVLGVPGTPWAEKRRANQEYWDRRIALAEALVEKVAEEELPFLVAGDFNTPDHGYIYRMFAREWADAHEEAGVGFGYSFPGTTRNPLSLFGPWLRIDYVFAGAGWGVEGAWAERERPSQHRAVAAELVYRGD